MPELLSGMLVGRENTNKYVYRCDIPKTYKPIFICCLVREYVCTRECFERVIPATGSKA